VVLHLGVDGLALGQRLVEGQFPEHRPQGRARQLVDGQLVVLDLIEGRLDVEDLSEDGGAHLQ